MNYLSSMSEEDGLLMHAICNSDELAIFRSDLIIDLVDFRWNNVAKTVHKIGFTFHLCYIFMLTLYIRDTYLGKYADDIPIPSTFYLFIIGLLLIYPAAYDGTQLIKEGPNNYFRGLWNWIDMFHIFGGYANIYI